MKFVSLLCVNVVCCLLLCTPIVGRAQRVDMPLPAGFNVGDRWEWRRVDALTKLEQARLVRTVTSIDPTLVFNETSRGTTKLSPTAIFVEGGYDPSSKPWRIWPLFVGSKWVLDANWRRPDGVSGHTKQDFEVLAYEEVVVPAGRYMAYRISGQGYYESRQNSTGRPARQTDTYWYAPEVNADVKHLRDDGYPSTTELISYQRGTASGTLSSDSAAVEASGSRSTPLRHYLDAAALNAQFVGKTVRLSRYGDGAIREYEFRRDGSASMQGGGRKRRSSSGTWEITDGKLCAHLGDDENCFHFFEQDGTLKAGPRDQGAKWQVIGIQ